MNMNSAKCILLVFTLMISASIIGQAVEGNLLSRWSDQSLPSSTIHDNRYNEVWGVVLDDREYAIIGTTWGTHFIDITDPANIIEVAKVQGAAIGAEIIHRDYHDYNGYLYAVCDEGSTSTLQIIDYSGLPDSVEVVYDSNELIRRAHNIFIDEDNAIMYALATAAPVIGNSPLRLYDISKPLEPTLIAEYRNIGGINMTGGGVHDAFVEDNIGYLNNGYNGFMVVDFTKPDSAVLITSLSPTDYPESGYNHSGWLNEEGTHYYMADENHGRAMKVVDVTAMPDLAISKVFDAESTSSVSIPHNQVVAGDYLYVSYYFDGLQVYDISEPSEPQRIMHYPTSSRAHVNEKYQGAWGVYPFFPSGTIIVSDMQEGLFVIEGVDKLSNINDALPALNLSIYPNPTSNHFQITGQKERISKVELINTAGMVVQKWGQSQNYLINEDIPNGLYHVRVSTSDRQISIPLIVD